MSFMDWLSDAGSGAWDYVKQNPEVAAAVLGGLAGSQGSEDRTATAAPYLFQGQEEGIVNFLDQSKQQYQGGPQKYYPGQTVAPLDPNTIAGQNSALGTLPVQQQMADAAGYGAGDMLMGGAGRIDGFNLPNQVGFGIDQGLENAVMNPIMRQLQEKVLPGINLNATSQGAFGGTRQGQMMSNAAQDATARAAEAVAQANLQARQQSIGQRSNDVQAMLSGRSQDINQNQIYNNAVRSGISAVPTAMDAQLVPSNIQGQVGQARTAYEQSLIGADKARFDFNQQAGIDSIDRLGQRMNLAPTGSINTLQGQDGTWLNMLGGALGGVSLVNSFQNTGNTQNLEQVQTAPPVGSLYDGTLFNGMFGGK
jgi:hypothetical protein